MAAGIRGRGAGWLLVLVAASSLAASCGGESTSEPALEPPATAEPLPPPPPRAEEPSPPVPDPPAGEEPPAAEEPPASTEQAPAPEPAPPPTPLPGLPRYTAGYEDWLRLNEDPIPPREGGDAHLSTKNVYASKEAMRTGGGLEYPVGTVIVKEGIRPDTDFIGLIAVMRKVRGADPEHGDWTFVEWVREQENAAFEELARDATCWGCHGEAAATDYVWVHTLERR